jgi:hypothetical protein
MNVIGISYPVRINETALKLEIYLDNNEIIHGEKYCVLLVAWTNHGSLKNVEKLYNEVKFGHVIFF